MVARDYSLRVQTEGCQQIEPPCGLYPTASGCYQNDWPIGVCPYLTKDISPAEIGELLRL